MNYQRGIFKIVKTMNTKIEFVAPVPVPVESIKIGSFVQRTLNAKITYVRGSYCREAKKYALQDCDDMSREIYVKKGTKLFTDMFSA